jgi:hypothetical protein
MLGDTNAMDEDHWYYRLAEEERPERWRFFRQPGAVKWDGQGGWLYRKRPENLENLPADCTGCSWSGAYEKGVCPKCDSPLQSYYKTGIAGKTKQWIKIFYANEYGFVSTGKPVHPEYVDSKHCSPTILEPDYRFPLAVGCDFGRTPAAAICQFIETWGRWVVLDELVTEDMSAALFAPQLKLYLDRHYPKMKVAAWGDPAGDHAGQTVETTPLKILRAHGIPIRPCHTNEPLLRRAAVTNPIMRNAMDGEPAFLLSPKAKIIRKGLMGGFCFRRLQIAGAARYTEEPDKNMYSHPVEALEYALLGGGEGHEAIRPAKSIRKYRGPRQEVAEM